MKRWESPSWAWWRTWLGSPRLNCRRTSTDELGVPLLGQIPLVQSICESGDEGQPAALDENTVTGRAFLQLAARVVRQVDRRNVEMPPTHIVEVKK